LAVPLSMSNPSTKSQLVIFLQGYLKRALTKQDLNYTCAQDDNVFTATVRLNCVDGQEFSGEPCGTEKEAEKSAAGRALQAYADEMEAAPSTVPRARGQRARRNKQQKAPHQPQLNPKIGLIQFFQAQLGRTLTKQDILYNVAELGDRSFLATVTLNCAQAQEFCGDTCPTVKDAEQSAAQQALVICSGGSAGALAPARDAESEPGITTPEPDVQTDAMEMADNEPKANKRKPELSGGQEKRLKQGTPVVMPNATSTSQGSLVELLQETKRRAMTKEDIIYNLREHTRLDGKLVYVATVTLNAHSGQIFIGRPCESQEEATQSAAERALQALSAPDHRPVVEHPPSQTCKLVSPPVVTASNSVPTVQGEDSCWDFFARGYCRWGEQCRFSHDHPPQEDGWICSSCSNYNWSTRVACNRCKIPKKWHAEFTAVDWTADVAGPPHPSSPPPKGPGHPGRVSKIADQGANDRRQPKVRLLMFLQVHVGRTLEKGDITYNTVGLSDDSFICSVQLNCIEGLPEFSGQPRHDDKQAEHSAALAALEAFSYEIAQLAHSDDPRRQKLYATLALPAVIPGSSPSSFGVLASGALVSGSGVATEGGFGADAGVARQTVHHRLRSGVGGWKGGAGARKSWTRPPPCLDFMRGDCQYGEYCKFRHDEVSPQPTGISSTALCPGSAGSNHWPQGGGGSWLQHGGANGTNTTTAAQETAQWATAKVEEGDGRTIAIQQTAEVQPPPPTLPQTSMPMQPLAAAGMEVRDLVKHGTWLLENGLRDDAAAVTAASAATPVAVSASSMLGPLQQHVLETPITGEVVDWSDRGFGWIQPHMVVPHHAASKHEGKIYVHQRDLVGAVPMVKGSLVQFRVFAGAIGLGASEVVAF